MSASLTPLTPATPLVVPSPPPPTATTPTPDACRNLCDCALSCARAVRHEPGLRAALVKGTAAALHTLAMGSRDAADDETTDGGGPSATDDDAPPLPPLVAGGGDYVQSRRLRGVGAQGDRGAERARVARRVPTSCGHEKESAAHLC